MQPECFDPSVATGAANQLQACTGDEGSRIAEQAEPRSGPPEEIIFLGTLILKPARDLQVYRRHRRGPNQECAQQQRVFAGEKRRLRANGVLDLCLRCDCNGYGNQRGTN